MKKIYLIILLNAVFLQADVLNLGINKNTKINSENIDSNKSLKKLSNQYFQEARKLYEKDEYKKALELFHKVLKLEPNNKRVILEIAQCNYMLKNYKEAKRLFLIVLNSKIPSNVKDNILAKLEEIKQLENKNNFQLNTFFSLLYDSNVSNTSNDDFFDIYIPLFGTYQMPNEDEKQEDFASEIGSSFVYSYTINDNLVLKNNFLAYTQKYFKYSQKDINLLAYSFTPTYLLNKNTKLSLEFYKDLIQLDNKNFQNNFSIKPSLSFSNLEDLIFETSMVFNKKRYNKEENTQRDANEILFSNSLTYYSNKAGVNKVTFDLINAKKTNGERTDVNNQGYALEYINSYKLSYDYMLSNTLKYKKLKYEQEDINFLSRRVDTTTTYTFDLSKSIKTNFIVGVNYKLIRNKSNHNIFTYDKNILKIYLSYSF